MRACVGLIVLDFPTVWAKDADEYISRGLAVHDHYRADPLIKTAFAPHAPYTVSDEPLQHIRMLADELDIGIHMHIHETASEIDTAVELTGKRPLARLQELGLVSPGLIAVHMTRLSAGEIDLLATAGGHVVHCPESNMKLASGICPLQELLAAGINVALGTDGAASNNDLDMLGEMRSAALLGKVVCGDASVLAAHEMLRMATLNGARALGLGEETGSLLPGKWADIAAVRLDTIETRPVYDPVSALLYACGREQVTDVWVAGQHLLKERHLTTLDSDNILDRAHAWQMKIGSHAHMGNRSKQTMTGASINVDQNELDKFEKLAGRWWDPHSEFKPLHDINPLRLDYIDRHASLQGKRVIDVGCGGGLLTEGMAARGAQVTGIDMGKAPLSVARLHQHESGLEIDYQQTTVEQLVEAQAGSFDIVTCMEMLEHVPDPALTISACAKLLKDDGSLFLSTINRNPKSYLFAVIGAEYILGLLPKGTHDYSRFIRPSEMEAWSRKNGLQLADITGLVYNPLTREYKLNSDVSVNYMTCFQRG